MLVGVDTGYEGKFDFPVRREPPALAYLLATVPRTGSTYLSHLLWRTGCLGAPLEYLNFEKGGPYSFASESPELQRELWRSLPHRRASPNGVFGIKCFPMQLQALVETNPALLSEVMAALLPPGRPPRIVHLARRDRAAHVASYARATLSGVWRKEQEDGPAAAPDYAQDALDAAERWLALQERGWEEMFRDLGVAPLRLWYEDAVARPGDAVRQVADYLGVTVVPAAAVPVPAVERQSGTVTSDWAERYRQSQAAAAAGTRGPG